MIHLTSLKENWINTVAKKYKADPILVEKMIRALYLLERLQDSRLNFIFKGGTALMLLLPEPKRFSIDIDIIVPRKPERIEAIFKDIIAKTDFIEYKEDKRTTQFGINKAHYKFYYFPVTNARAEREYILLDILYEESHYGLHTQQVEINSPFLMTKEQPVKVLVPTPEAILGDKLTAFAPKTTGILYGSEKEIEIIKQLFDIGELFNIVGKVAIIAQVFDAYAKAELKYRKNEHLSPKDVLQDILGTAMLISTRGKSGDGNYEELQKGIRNIKNFIFTEHFHQERAILPAAKAAYLAALIQTKARQLQRFSDREVTPDWVIKQPFETRLNKLKKSNLEAFFHWYHVYELIGKE